MENNQRKNPLFPILIFVTSWLVPGSGFFLLRKKLKGAVFFGGVLCLILLGLLMKGEIGTLHGMQPIYLLGFLGSVGNGIFFLLFKLTPWGAGDLAAATFLYGTAYIAVAGFLNLLIATKAYALAKGGQDV